MNDYQVVVVGAGPAGIATAIELHRRTVSVCVIDKASFPRDKTCGDGLTTAALRQLHAIGFDPTTVASWTPIHETTWRSPSGHTINLDVPQGKGLRIAVARRRDLDESLVNLARSKGIEVREQTTLNGASISSSGVTIATDRGVITSDIAVGADGIYSPLRKLLSNNPDRYLGELHAFRQYISNVTGPASERLWVSFDRDILPGYIWAFPVGNGCVNLGFGVERSEKTTGHWMNHTWENILSRPHVRNALGESFEFESPHRAWPIPTKIHKSALTVRNRVLFVGDAARSVDPLTGEGIAQALETGKLAASSIADHIGDGYSTVRAYEHRIKTGIVHDHKFASILAAFVRHEVGARLAIRMAPLGPQRGRYAMRWVFEDNPRSALLTPWRWSERFTDKSAIFEENKG